ncbi:hypothetical protein HS7_04660 [Sulfolobales archaeon HS-7]|nr:hypothetical protein HS7_04660 [Sulfolobales archaeon HS-7]
MERVLITGRPGVGKTTIILKVIELLNKERIRVGGFVCPEIRSFRRREGFKIIDVMTNEQEWLARVGNGKNSYGRYIINEKAGEVGFNAVRRAIDDSAVIIIDEIGPMELTIPFLRRAIDIAFQSDRSVVGVIHRNVNIPYKFVKIPVDERNRDTLPRRIVEIITALRQ